MIYNQQHCDRHVRETPTIQSPFFCPGCAMEAKMRDHDRILAENMAMKGYSPDKAIHRRPEEEIKHSKVLSERIEQLEKALQEIASYDPGTRNVPTQYMLQIRHAALKALHPKPKPCPIVDIKEYKDSGGWNGY